MLLCDLDHFKQINDTFGHSAGDLVFIEISRILVKHGTAGRIGGDEFALWVKADGAAGADSEVGEKIVAEVAAAFEGDQQPERRGVDRRRRRRQRPGGRDRACRQGPVRRQGRWPAPSQPRRTAPRICDSLTTARPGRTPCCRAPRASW